MKIVRVLLLSATFFSLGFLANALFFQKNTVEITALSQPSVLGLKDPDDQFITSVAYDGEQFNPRSVTVKKGNYIAITNTSKEKLMWLVSDNPDLSTVRGYGEGERLQLILLKAGEYKVANTLNTKAWILVTVKE